MIVIIITNLVLSGYRNSTYHIKMYCNIQETGDNWSIMAQKKEILAAFLVQFKKIKMLGFLKIVYWQC